MKSAEYVDKQVEKLKKTGNPLQWVAWQIALLCVGWAYVFGALGEYCSPTNRKKYFRSKGAEHPTIAELLWEKSSTEFQFERSWGWIYVRYPDDPEIVPGTPFRLHVRFRRCSNRITDLKLRMLVPEGWSCPNSDQGIYIAHHRYGEERSFDLIAPENAPALSYVQLEIRRNGFLCPEIITLPMQIKGMYGSAIIQQSADPLDDWRIRFFRAQRELD